MLPTEARATACSASSHADNDDHGRDVVGHRRASLAIGVGFVTADAGQTWTPSTDVAKGFGGAVSGDQIHHLGDGKSYAYVSEFNAYTNGTKCSHGDVSPQCSGVLLTRDGGYTYEHIDWGGTDGAGTDASSGAFPSPERGGRLRPVVLGRAALLQGLHHENDGRRQDVQDRAT